MAVKKKPKTLRCRFCGDECEQDNRDSLSWWSHNHPAHCPYRQDRMPALNGVHVGDVWRNLHTKEELVVTEIRLGGAGTYTDREPVFVLGDRDALGGHPMWSLVEHWEPISRPGSYPVPWTRSKRFRGRSALVKWRGVGMRGRKPKRGRQYAMWHSYHKLRDEFSIDWDRTNVLWQTDPERESWEEVRKDALELINSGDEHLAEVGKAMLEHVPLAA